MDSKSKYLKSIQLILSVVWIMSLSNAELNAQFAPPAGIPGSTAVKADTSIIIAWANNCTVERGPMDISEPNLGLTYYGDDEDAHGIADNAVVSLGDGGIATLQFEVPIVNGPGFDFAVFENSFLDTFLELAIVEVSSDGINYFEFPSTSNSQTETQIETFGSIDATEINNLAGKYIGGYGTPFDLEDLKGITELNLDRIISIRIIDVIGSINTDYATYDSYGIIINDPWPTPFESSGFDLDAVGIIHDEDHLSVDDMGYGNKPLIGPNPAFNIIHISNLEPNSTINIYNNTGYLLLSRSTTSESVFDIDISSFNKGLLFLRISNKKGSRTMKLIHQ